MRMQERRIGLIAMVAGCVFTVTCGFAASIPFSEGYEDYAEGTDLNGTGGWTVKKARARPDGHLSLAIDLSRIYSCRSGTRHRLRYNYLNHGGVCED